MRRRAVPPRFPGRSGFSTAIDQQDAVDPQSRSQYAKVLHRRPYSRRVWSKNAGRLARAGRLDSGKTMLAQRGVTVLPPLSSEEATDPAAPTQRMFCSERRLKSVPGPSQMTSRSPKPSPAVMPRGRFTGDVRMKLITFARVPPSNRPMHSDFSPG
jgi:hypothetical protein